MINKYLSLIDERKHIGNVSKKCFKYWTKLHPVSGLSAVELSLPPPLGWSAKGFIGGRNFIGPITSGPVHTQPPELVLQFAVNKDPEGSAQLGRKDRASIDGKESKEWQTLNALLRKGQLEPRAWWGFELWADSSRHDDIIF